MTAASTTLSAGTASVPVARRFVRTALEALGLDGAYEAVPGRPVPGPPVRGGPVPVRPLHGRPVLAEASGAAA